jgi:hypothetical protein
LVESKEYEYQSHNWLSMATRGSVVRRAIGYAVVVGAILIAINHGDAILAGTVDTPRAARMLLTVLVPYCVSTLSSVGALRVAERGSKA